MPKPHTLPRLFDDCNTLSITKFKEWNYLTPNKHIGGTMDWSVQGELRSQITFELNTLNEDKFIILSYKCNGEPIQYKVYFEMINSNLGKGKVWYFRCPQTNLLCRKLYLINSYFLHRKAHKNSMYEIQTQSKNYRQMAKTLGTYFKLDELHEQLYKKHFKKTYAGKPTKRYLRIMEQIKKATN